MRTIAPDWALSRRLSSCVANLTWRIPVAGNSENLKMQAGVSSLVETFVGFSANETAEQGAVIAQLVLGEHRLYEARPERARFADGAVAAIECNGVGLLQLVKEMGGILTGDDARRR